MDLAHEKHSKDMGMYRKNPVIGELNSVATRHGRLKFNKLVPWPRRFKLGAWIIWRATVDLRTGREDKHEGRIIQITDHLVFIKSKHYIKTFARRDLHDGTVELL